MKSSTISSSPSNAIHAHSILQNQFGIMLLHLQEAAPSGGGDGWGIFNLSERCVYLYFCDVSGHDEQAASYYQQLRHDLPALLEHCSALDQMMQRLNRHLYALLPTERYVSLLLLEFNQLSPTLRYAAAAMPHPVLWQSKENQAAYLDGSGLPLGISPDASYPVKEHAFLNGDELLLYSDALIENRLKDRNHNDPEAKIAEKWKGLKRNKTKPTRILPQLRAIFSKDHHSPYQDDLTMLYLRRMSMS